MENRLEILRREIDKLIIEKQADEIQYFIAHLYGVSGFCALLALRRNLNAEIAATCGMLHDIYQITDGTSEKHAEKGAEKAKQVLQALGLYSDGEIETITTAISKHNKKLQLHEPYCELLKDADVMHHFLYNRDFPVKEQEKDRYNSILAELGVSGQWLL